MKQLYRASAIAATLFFLFLASAVAQDISSIDFQNLRSADLSDQQIQRLWQRAQDEGYTISQLEQMALARGMQPTEVTKLVRRLRNIRMQGGQQQTQRRATQLRTVQTDSLAIQPDSLRKDTAKHRIFGSSLFRRDKVTFTPSLNIPTPENYQLGPGDQLIIDIWGAAEQTYELTISPEGTITIANLGPIYVNGLTIERARERIKSSLSRIYSGLQADPDEPTDTQARISLGNVRSINVTVLGEARFPGTYTLPSLATVFNALYSAGGPDSTGTYRDIEVIRGDSIAARLDIYDFLVYGDQSDNIRLRDQDIIKIDPYISRVDLQGRTKRTGLFELKEGETIQDLVNFAGGFASNAYTKRLTIVGNTGTQKRINDVSYPQQSDFRLHDGDSLYVGKVLDRFANRVEIQGAVFRPGGYELKDSTTVHSLIQRAEGVKEDAFMNRGLIYREQPDLTIEAVPFSVREVLTNPEDADISLQRNDIVQISSIFDLREDYTISVVGAVQEPGTFPYVENMTLEDVILQADGFKESAAPYRIEVSRRIDSGDSTFVPREIADIHRFRVDENLELGDEAAKFTLKPFDKVFIRNSPSYFEQEQVTIKGEVLFPGKYTLDQKYMRISDLIQRAGGLTQYSYPQGANLTREIEQKVDTTFLNIPDTLQDGNDLQQNTTRVGIELAEIINNPGGEGDLILRAGDVLEIPKELQTVQIAGEVLYPISVRYERGISFKQYLRAAGGASEQGKPKDAYIVYANGEVDRARKILFFRDYPRVRPGATIYVPRKEPGAKLSPQERISIFSAIVSMAAIVSNTIFQISRN
ncbi:SLBB domain-containing protein [Aliifodinibius sp. S!AR15-10]|uniref:polysaccharide biosynthesis/export family protein n=1 Tax=Aliifodinibius sp. S!AR15-10 TaxID=2950437 RepID=UPI00285964DE|nr:SLBB domain-containing protein [Aliifodinibius sp. S!AR15-10]MDR8393405.1 SLBB domain-containing protein [Aliifodinibius sp. S!AR15-10]